MLEDAVGPGAFACVEVVAEQVGAVLVPARGFAFTCPFRIPIGVRGAGLIPIFSMNTDRESAAYRSFWPF